VDNEFIPKSRLYRESYLPGGVVKLRNGSYAQVRGTRNSSLDLGAIDTTQLLDVIRSYVTGWENMNGAITDSALRDAIDRKTLMVQCPSEIYLSPFPFVLHCQTCKAIDFYQVRDERRAITRIDRRIRNINGRERVTCKTPGCNGAMVQVPYLSVHRCGSATGVNLPFQALRVPNIDFNDSGGTFLTSSFSNHDTGEKIATALSMPCPACKTRHPSLGELSQRGTTILNGEAFFPHNVQYISLPPESGRLVSEVCSHFLVAGPLTGLASDLAEGVASGLLGLVPPDVLRQQFTSLLSNGGADDQAVVKLEPELTVKRLALEKYAGLGGGNDPLAQTLLESIRKEIKELEERLASAKGVFRTVRDHIGDSDLVRSLASERRVQEAVFFRGSFQEISVSERLASEPDMNIRDSLGKQWDTLKAQYGVDQITHIADLNVVLAALGYTRERRQPNTELTDVAPVVLRPFEDRVDQSLNGQAVAYAMSAGTEGLWVRFDPRRILAWCKAGFGWTLPSDDLLKDRTAAHAYLLQTCPPLRLSPGMAVQEARRHHPSLAAPFHLIHTIAHCLLSTAKRHTGYDEMSLAEYLLPMDLSFLVYVTSVQNYTAGGLYGLFKHYLLPWFDDASNFAFQCLFDPVCSDSGASCSGCVQRVLGCETFNRGLSRAYLFGGSVNEEDRTLMVSKGFWNL